MKRYLYMKIKFKTKHFTFEIKVKKRLLKRLKDIFKFIIFMTIFL